MNRAAQVLAERFSERGAQVRLAEETGIDQGYLSKMARGERVPGLAARRKLRDALAIPLELWDEPIEETEDAAPTGDAA